MLSASNLGLTRKRTKGQQFWKNSPSNQLLCQCKYFSWCHRGISSVNPGSAALGAEPSTRAALSAATALTVTLPGSGAPGLPHRAHLSLTFEGCTGGGCSRERREASCRPWEAEREPCAFLHLPALPSFRLGADASSLALARRCLSHCPSVRIINNLFKTLEIFPGKRLALRARCGAQAAVGFPALCL